MIIPFLKQEPTLESLCERATDGVSDWLLALVDRMPGVIPDRDEPTGEGGAVADELRRFVHEVVTRNPVTRGPLSNVQLYLVELALDCVDWEDLADHPRLRGLDRTQARLARP